ncbi:hypothetical protein TeGR_g10046, partial [Tetraparma gracilis]
MLSPAARPSLPQSFSPPSTRLTSLSVDAPPARPAGRAPGYKNPKPSVVNPYAAYLKKNAGSKGNPYDSKLQRKFYEDTVAEISEGKGKKRKLLGNARMNAEVWLSKPGEGEGALVSPPLELPPPVRYGELEEPPTKRQQNITNYTAASVFPDGKLVADGAGGVGEGGRGRSYSFDFSPQ